MIIDDIWFELKDGRKPLIRSPKEEDIQDMLDYLRISSGETDFILRTPEECAKFTYEKEKAFFENCNNSKNEAMLVCLVDGKVAGNCHVQFNEMQKTKHRASVAIALLKEFWNLGIGTRLFQEMIRICEERGDILQMELDFIEGNDRARHLYEKMGFRITGVKQNAIRLPNGKLLNEYMMIREMGK